MFIRGKFYFLLAIIIAPIALVATNIPHREINLKVGYLYDSRFPNLETTVIENSFRYALQAIQDEFELSDISFSSIEILPIADFFSNTLRNKSNTFSTFNPFTNKIPYELTKKQKKYFYKYYKLADLKKFLPDDRKGSVSNLEQYHKIAMETWYSKSIKMIEYQIDGKPVFTKETLYFQTYSQWRTMLLHQTNFDILFHNTLVFFDDIDNPYPHTIFLRGTAGGIGSYSPHAPSGFKGAFTVPYITYSGLDSYSDNHKLSSTNISKYIGIYYIAHEFGHAFLNLPDVYNHPLHCLMNTPPENFDQDRAIEEFENHRGYCPKCKPQILKEKKRLVK